MIWKIQNQKLAKISKLPLTENEITKHSNSQQEKSKYISTVFHEEVEVCNTISYPEVYGQFWSFYLDWNSNFQPFETSWGLNFCPFTGC